MKKFSIIILLALVFHQTMFSSDMWNGAETFVREAVSENDSLKENLHIKERFLPVSRRMDRGINDITFVYKKEIALGLDVSYGTLSSDDSNIMLLIDGLDFKGSVFTVNPSVGYFFADNLCVGTRFGYTKIDGSLGNVSLDLGPEADMDLSLSDVMLKSQMTSMGLFMRSYAGVDPKGVFGLFAELELMYKTGHSMFSYNSGEGLDSTYSNNMRLELGISTGVAVYIMPSVCCNFSFGLGGLSWNRIKQHDQAGVISGGRTATKMLWKLNLLDIGIGFNIHL